MSNIENREREDIGPVYFARSGDSSKDIQNLGLAQKALDSYTVLSRTSGAAQSTPFEDVQPNVSVRNQFTRTDYEYFRPGESLPRQQIEIMSMCNEAYRKIGIVRNIIDLMSDFSAKGVSISHPNSRIQKFYRGWFKKVNGSERSERFLNLLYRLGNVVVKRGMAKITLPDETSIRTSGQDKLEPDIEIQKNLKTGRRTIPIKYTFLNPMTLTVLGEQLSQFVGKTVFALKISPMLRTAITTPKTPFEQELISQLPDDIRTAILSGQSVIPLDSSKVRAFYYKKDDWKVWADPFIFCILSNLIVLEKMQLADLAALDGVISQVRLWKLGDLDKGIFPTDAAVQKLNEILLSNPGGGAFDIIWGPELSLEVSKSDVWQFLGKTKYEPVLNFIFAGLGVPPTLTGVSTASGFTNNYISLQTLIERLEYGRSVLTQFWEEELELVRQAMGFMKPATITFDNMVLTDKTAMLALYLQLVDRNLVSMDTVIEKFGEQPDFEYLKLKQEKKDRDAGLTMPKVGPYIPDENYELVKVALMKGYVSPEQAGLELEPSTEETLSPLDKQLKSAEKVKTMIGIPGGGGSSPSTKKGKSGQGRPKNSGDTTKRTRNPKPLSANYVNTAASYFTTYTWARDAYNKISDFITPVMLNHYQKKNIRSLSAVQTIELENTKTYVFSNLKPFCEVNEKIISDILSSTSTMEKKFNIIYSRCKADFIEKNRRDITMEELRNLQISIYSVLYSDEV